MVFFKSTNVSFNWIKSLKSSVLNAQSPFSSEFLCTVHMSLWLFSLWQKPSALLVFSLIPNASHFQLPIEHCSAFPLVNRLIHRLPTKRSRYCTNLPSDRCVLNGRDFPDDYGGLGGRLCERCTNYKRKGYLPSPCGTYKYVSVLSLADQTSRTQGTDAPILCQPSEIHKNQHKSSI